MSFKDLDPFNYSDLKPLNYKHKQNMQPDIDLITKTLENITNDWKERESSLQYIGRIVKGNQGKSDFFIKYFNNKLCSSLEIQLSDLRSTVMKEACRITSLCARELGLSIEQGVTQLLTQNCLFKIAGSANQVISESASKCILNILRYVHSIKVITNICEIKSMKANSVRILCAQSLVNMISYYDTNIIIKVKNILEDTIQVLLVDANAEVRATTRKSFILYKSRFNNDANKIFEKLGKNVQKQILEDEKNFDKFNIKVKYDKNVNLIKSVNEIIDKDMNKINNINIQNKPKTPELNLFKKKSSKDFSKKATNTLSKTKDKRKRSTSKKKNNYSIEKEKEKNKKEETVKYINVDDDDIVENDDDIEDDKKGNEDSREVNMVLNYNTTITKNKNQNKISFNKRNTMKNNNDISSNNSKNIENKSLHIEAMSNISKENKIINNEIKLTQSQNINTIQNINNKDANDIIKDLLIKPEEKTDNIEHQKISKTVSNLTKEKTNDLNSNKYIISNTTRVSNKNKFKYNENNELNPRTNIVKKNKIKKHNTKFDQLNSVKNFTLSMKYVNNSNNSKENKTLGKSGEKIKVIKYEVNKNKSSQTNNLKKINNNNNSKIKSSKAIDNNEFKINNKNINDSEKEQNNELNKDITSKENIETVKISLNEDQNSNSEEEIDTVINLDKKRSKTKVYNNKTMEKIKYNITNQNQYNLNKKENKNNNPNIYENATFFKENNNTNLDNKTNLQELYNELSNTNSTPNRNEDSNINNNNETIEQKVVVILNKLDNLINPNDKLIFFQYLFNYFNTILTDIKSFSQNTIKKYKDIHIDNLKENDSNLVEQVIKNLMRMIFYLNNIFTIYDIELILKILLFSINDFKIKTLKKLSYDLLEIIKKKCDNEELFQSVYSLLSDYNSNYDDCYEFMILLIPSCDKILKNLNYFKQVFRLICLTDINSKKVGKIIDILYRNYRDNFNQAFDEELPNNKQQILMFMEKLNSFYFREFKSNHEKNNSMNITDNNKINNDSIITNNNQISSSIMQPKKKIEKIESGNINYNKENFSNKNSDININFENSIKSNTESHKSNNIIYNQNTKNSNDIHTINTNLNGNNIISINNSNNNNIIITNKIQDDFIPNEIKTAIKNNDIEQYLLYIRKHKSYIPDFILLLSNKKYSEQKYIIILLNFLKNILNNTDFSIDLDTCINLILKQIKLILNTFKNNQKIEELIKNILSDMPIYLNSEKCLISMAKYLTSDTDVPFLDILILSLEDFVKNYKNKKEGINIEMKPLQDLLNFFINEIFNLLKHQNSEIRKRALFCCLEVYTVIGKEFETFMAKIPNAQQNLIKLYIKKRIG